MKLNKLLNTEIFSDMEVIDKVDEEEISISGYQLVFFISLTLMIMIGIGIILILEGKMYSNFMISVRKNSYLIGIENEIYIPLKLFIKELGV